MKNVVSPIFCSTEILFEPGFVLSKVYYKESLQESNASSATVETAITYLYDIM